MAKRIQKSALVAGVVTASVLFLALHYLTAEGETFYRYTCKGNHRNNIS